MKKSSGLFIMTCLVSGYVFAVSSYHVTDLGTQVSPLALNDTGQIVLRQYGGQQEIASVWENGQITVIHQCGNTYFYRAAINNDGKIIGNCSTIDMDYAFSWENGNVTTVENTRYWDINQQGEILGQEWVSGNKGFIIRTDSTKEYLPCPEGITYIGLDISDSGEIAGATDFFSSELNAFAWNPSSGTRQLLPRPGDYISAGLHIDNQSRVMGYSVEALNYNEEQEMNLVYWNSLGELVDLNCTYLFFGHTPSMNKQGQIVGMLKLSGSSDFLPYLWQEDTGFICLQGLLDGGWTINSIAGINNLGEIIGLTDNGHGVLLTPVPEPASLIILFLGAALFKRR